MSARGNGMYYTSASVKRRKDRKGKPWQGVLKYKDSKGKWKLRRKTFKDVSSYGDAQTALAEWRKIMEQQAQEELKRAKPAKTVGDAVREYLEIQRDLGKLSKATYQKQIRVLELSIEPYFDNKDFYNVTRAEVSEYVRSLSTKYKPQSVRTMYAILSKTYKEAVRNEELVKNPCSFIALPEVGRPQINDLDKDGRRKFLAAINTLDKGDWRYISGLLAYYAGLRASEICALTWQDINLAKKTIQVNKAARTVKDSNGRNIVEVNQRTKTNASYRTIYFPNQLKEALLAYLGDASPKASDPVLDKRHCNPSNMCGCFLSWTRANGILGRMNKPITIHCLRHTYATVQVQMGTDIKTLSSQLGHAKADITLNIYANSDDNAKKTARDNAEAFYENEEGSDF